MTAALLFALGLVLGFAVGFAGRGALEALSSSWKDNRMNQHSKVPVVSVVGVIALVLTLALNSVVGVLLMTTRQSTERYSHCTADWQQEFAAAYQARLAASVAVDKELDRVIRAVYAQDRAAFSRAVQAYIRTRDQQGEERVKNPLPPLPERVCGQVEVGRQ